MRSLPTSDLSLATDWFELLALERESALLRRSAIETLVAVAAPDMEASDREAFVGDLTGEITRRAGRGGALYPLDVDRRGLVRTNSSASAVTLYRFLLLCSVVPAFRTSRKGFAPGAIFEEIARAALQEFTRGQAVVFSSLAAGIRPRITELGRRLHVQAHPKRARIQRKDHGLDVVAWRDFADRRAGHPVILCQCAIENSGLGLVAKARQIAPGEWGAFLDLREGTFTAALAVPHALGPEYVHWDELRRNTDLVLERMRILALVENAAATWNKLDDPRVDRFVRSTARNALIAQGAIDGN